MGEREQHINETEPNMLLLRAVRSLAWNRLLSPLVQSRLERAEHIVRSQLLLQGDEKVKVGPYEVSINEDEEIALTWQPSDDWQQPNLPESAPFPEDPLDLAGKPLP